MSWQNDAVVSDRPSWEADPVAGEQPAAKQPAKLERNFTNWLLYGPNHDGGGGLAGYIKGVRDLADGGAQLVTRGLNKIGLVPDSEVARVEQINRDAEQQYQQGREATGQTGTDWQRAVGNVAATSVALPLRAAAPTMLGRVGQGAAIGAASGALQPVNVKEKTLSDLVAGENAPGFWEQKAEQVGFGAAYGAAATPAIELLMRGGTAAVNQLRTLASRQRATPQKVQQVLQQSMQQTGVRWSALSDDVKDALIADVATALRTGDNLSPQQVARLMDVRAVGATPTRGAVTLDPVQITQERNLAKIGANTSDPNLSRLSQLEGENNRALVARLNTLRGDSTADEFATGAKVVNALRARDDQAASAVKNLYAKAEQANAGAITLDGTRFVDEATTALDSARRGAFLPAQVRSIMQDIAEREQRGMPMTLNDVEQLRTILAAEARKASRSGDGNAATAISVVRDALEAAPTRNIEGLAANDAFNRARSAHRTRMQARDKSPALAAAIDGAEPDRFVQQYIIAGNATAADVKELSKALAADPDALNAIRGHIVNYLKTKALNQASDEVGSFSQSAYNKALNEIGERKLSAFFSPDEIASLKQVGRAASYLQVQPKGSAVNNSNTAAAASVAIDNIARRLPFGQQGVSQPLNNIVQGRQASNALQKLMDGSPEPWVSDEMVNHLLPLTTQLSGATGGYAAR